MLDKRFLETLFNEDEQVCVTDHKAAYRSIPLSDLRNKLVDLTKNDGSDFKLVPVESLKLISINPIKGPRNDESCTAYRNFLIEMDDSALAQQWSYIQELNLPYSLCVFSGGKSLHFAVCLQESLPSEEIYRYYAEWILNVVSQADQNTKNPSRGIRIPGVEREPGQFQKLIDARDRISHDTLLSWLNDYRGFKPKLYEKTQHYPEDATFEPVYHSLWKKTRDQLRDGIDASKGRNTAWFKIGIDFGRKGFGYDEMMGVVEQSFTPESTFTAREWADALKQGHDRGKKARYGKKGE